MIVDDDVQTRTMMNELMQIYGAETLWASNAREATRMLSQEAVHMVLSDIGLPDLDGFAVATALAARARGTRIVLTSSRDTVDHARVVASGARGFLPKDQLCVAALLPLLHDEEVA